MQGEAYDFIVTGAGSAGCAVAGRLSEDGRYRVLLLEAGPKDSYPWIHIPLGYHKTFNNPRVNWMFDSEPEPELNNRIMYQPRGKVLGGTSSINGMVYMRGNAADYDEWRQRGCEGWDYDSVLPYFKRRGPGARPRRVPRRRRAAESLRPSLAADLGQGHARSGPAGRHPGQSRLQRPDPGRRGLLPDHHQPGAALVERARLSARCEEAQGFPIATSAHATRVLIENGRAVGVEYRTPDGLQTARANREVIVSGGVYGSPQLLMLSGVGPAEHLNKHGIAVIKDMPGVGSNLHAISTPTSPTSAPSPSP